MFREFVMEGFVPLHSLICHCILKKQTLLSFLHKGQHHSGNYSSSWFLGFQIVMGCATLNEVQLHPYRTDIMNKDWQSSNGPVPSHIKCFHVLKFLFLCFPNIPSSIHGTSIVNTENRHCKLVKFCFN